MRERNKRSTIPQKTNKQTNKETNKRKRRKKKKKKNQKQTFKQKLALKPVGVTCRDGIVS